MFMLAEEVGAAVMLKVSLVTPPLGPVPAVGNGWGTAPGATASTASSTLTKDCIPESKLSHVQHIDIGLHTGKQLQAKAVA